MRIAVLAEDYPPNQGGIADYAGNLVLALVNDEHDVRVVAPHVSGDDSIDKKSPAPICRVGELNVRRKRLGLLARKRAVAELSAGVEKWLDEIAGEAPVDFAIVTSVSTWADLCIKRGLPYIVCVHGGDAFGKRADFIRSVYRKWAVRRVLSRASYVAANSGFTKKQIIVSGIGENKIVVTYCGVADEFLQALEARGVPSLPETVEGRLVMMCRLVRFKACDVVLKAVWELKGKYPNLFLSIAGDGPEKKSLERLASELGIEDKVRFLGYVGDVARKVELFGENEIFVLSGRFDPETGRLETFGIVFAEAGACARPVVGPRLGGVPEVISDSETGYLADPDDVKSLVNAIDDILSSKGKARNMGEAGKKRVLKRFNYKRIARDIVSVMS